MACKSAWSPGPVSRVGTKPAATRPVPPRSTMPDLGTWLGYQLLKNGPDGVSWDANASGSLSKSSLNAGYLSAGTARSAAAAARYTEGKLNLTAAISNIQYQPNAASRFKDVASFNTFGVTSTWQTATPWLLGASAAYTRENRANGIGDPANYRQLSLEQIYALSRHIDLYLVQARQLARGRTLGASGTPVAAVAVIGDAELTTPSSSGRQNVIMAGMRYDF
jgi:predicted porin